jgi:pimeloyl-ACP methyl ester carboxylesterase
MHKTNVLRTIPILFTCSALLALQTTGKPKETLPALKDNSAPRNQTEMWMGFDPQAEPLDIEILKEWEEDGVVLKVLRYRIGVFKGKKAMMAAVYGHPKGARNLPGLVQIHGGGQYADYRAPLANAHRGYASISISWAGRIFAPGYTVRPNEVKLFWDGKMDDPNYKLTTDWGALDAYHAPSRNGKDAFPSIPVAEWTLDPVESPRNNSWFLATLGARRGLTFLERQPEVDGTRLGVYGHSMGGKLTVMTAGSDKRVKAAAPSCGGISDRYSKNPLHLATVSDPPSLKKITCPILFLSPSNDFHGRINDLEHSTREIKARNWRVTCSPHHNHQDSPPYEVATQLWFDQHLKGTGEVPATPALALVLPKGKDPVVIIVPDDSKEISYIDVFYTQDGQMDGKRDDTANTKSRFWHHAPVEKHKGKWAARLSLFSTDKPLWVYANVRYKLDQPISGAGYYYGSYTANSFNLSSIMQVASAEKLKAAGTIASLKPSTLIEDFKGEWEKEWFSYKPEKWGVKTHKVYHQQWAAPTGAEISFEVRAAQANVLVVGIDDHASEVRLEGKGKWQAIELSPADFKDAESKPLANWKGIKQFRLEDTERLRPPRESKAKPKLVGAVWKGKPPEFRNLHWTLE